MPEIRFIPPAAVVVTGLVLAYDPACVGPMYTMGLYLLFVASAVLHGRDRT